MKGLTVMVALTGLCFLAQPCYAQGNTFCEGFLRSGDRTDLVVCIQHLDREAGIVEQERDYELAGITMSNADLTKSVKDLHASIHDIEQKTTRINPYEVSDTTLLTDDLRDRVKDLEKQIDAQGTLLDAQSQQIEDLRKQVNAMRAELVTKPRVHFQTEAQRPATPPKTHQPIQPSQPNNNVKKATPPQ
jgi:small-conductance mechanosensitive channel